MNRHSLMNKRADLQDALDVLLNQARDASGQERDFTPGEHTRFLSLKTEIESIDQQLKQLDIEAMKKAAAAVPIHVQPGDLPPGQASKTYSLSRLLKGVIDQHRTPEMDVSDRLKAEFGAGDGWALPALLQKTALTGSLANAGALVSDATGGLIDALLAPSLLAALPIARMSVPRGQGRLVLPRVGTTSTAYWTAEGAAPTESNPSFEQIALTPKTVSVYCRFSRLLLQTSSPAIDSLLQQDMAKALSTALDTALLEGSGTLQPTGIIGQAGSTITEASQANLWDTLSAAVAALDSANVPSSGRSWLVNPATAGRLRTTFVQDAGDASDGQIIYAPGGTGVMGIPVVVHSSVPSATALLAHWPSVLAVDWGTISLVIDPYSQAESGLIRLIIAHFVDYAVRHPAAVIKLTLAS